MSEIISIGIDRGYGIARSLYEKSRSKRKNTKFDYNFSHHYRITKQYPRKSIQPIVMQKLLEAHESGAICIQTKDLFEALEEGNLKNIDLEKEISIRDMPIVLDEGNIYLKSFRNLEISFCEMLKKFLEIPETEVRKLKIPEGLKLGKDQEIAIQKSLCNSFSIITGGPGTGKTTILKVLLTNLVENSYSPERIQIVTPTGKAAKRVLESSKELFDKGFPEPKTIHKLISYNPNMGLAYYNEENPLDLDVIILDEASMADIHILEMLLKAFPFDVNKKLVFVGDPDQLLPVSSGAVFSDLVEFGVNVSKLKQSYRQTKEALIIQEIAEETNVGKSKRLMEQKGSNIQKIASGTQLILEEDSEKIVSLLEEWYGMYANENSQILTPFNQGKLGIDGINEMFSQKNKSEKYPAIVVQNLQEISLFNGETGWILEESSDHFTFSIDKEIYKIPYYLKNSFKPAYAITIHKSQGSEYDHVCIVIPPPSEKSNKSGELFTRRLLYTAITRAKKSLTLLGSETSLLKAIESVGFPRYSGIRDRIQ